jgi:hypothetical protein
MKNESSSTCLQKSATESCLSQFLVHIFTTDFCENQLILSILPSIPRSLKWSLSLKLSDHSFVYTSAVLRNLSTLTAH